MRLFAVFSGVGALALLIALTLMNSHASFAARPAVTWPTLTLTLVTNNIIQPVHITHAGDGSGRLFIVEREGRIRIYQNGALLSTPFLDIANRVESAANVEQGLLSVAFPPGYASRLDKNHFYVYYTKKSTWNLILARYRVSANPNIADPNSEQIVLSIPHPNNSNHNGGQLQFSPRDGYLYMGTGDGGAGGDPPNNAQNTSVLLGKLLRLDVETGNPLTYTIPSSNPFVGVGGYRPEIWALGLRNPWRFSFDRQTRDLYIGDVGQATREEVDFQPAASAGGQNYGWSCYEGTLTYRSDRCSGSITYTFPITEYDHSDPTDCAMVGGYVFRGPLYPSMRGIYFYVDHCSGKLWGLQYDGTNWQNQLLLNSGLNISSFGEDEAGNLYVADLDGAVYQLVGNDPPPFQHYLPIIAR